MIVETMEIPVLKRGRKDKYAQSTQDWCLEQVLTLRMSIQDAGRAKGVPESVIRFWIKRKKKAQSVTADQACSEAISESSESDYTSARCGGTAAKSEGNNEAAESQR